MTAHPNLLRQSMFLWGLLLSLALAVGDAPAAAPRSSDRRPAASRSAPPRRSSSPSRIAPSRSPARPSAGTMRSNRTVRVGSTTRNVGKSAATVPSTSGIRSPLYRADRFTRPTSGRNYNLPRVWTGRPWDRVPVPNVRRTQFASQPRLLGPSTASTPRDRGFAPRPQGHRNNWPTIVNSRRPAACVPTYPRPSVHRIGRPSFLRPCYVRPYRTTIVDLRPSNWYDPWYGDRFDTNYVHQTVYAQTVIPPAVDTVVIPSTEPTVEPQPIAPVAQSQAVDPGNEVGDPRVLAWLEEGESALRAGRLDEAERAFLRASLADPNNGFTALLYAVAMFLHGDVNSSAAAIRHALDATPELITDPVDVRQLVGDQSLLMARIDDLTARSAASPDNADAALLLGYIKYATGRAWEASAVFAEHAAQGDEDPLFAALAEAAQTHAQR